MNATQPQPKIESRFRTYFQAATFLLPALIVWAFTVVFVFPKAQQLCREAGMPPLVVNSAVTLLKDRGGALSLALVTLLILLEWRVSGWPRYRRGFAGATVFLVNAAVLVLLAGMLVAVVMAGPALLQQR